MMDAKEKEKKLKLMRFWLFGLFAIVFAGFTVYFGMFAGAKLLAEVRYWVAIILAAALCIAGFLFYQWYLGRK